ncbi:MAG: aldo/keto reductase [Candidatus Sumerlaeota bacterium]|nr:aldo/keto reductase [Candidatus Sumerlaeota bacterium]
MPKRPLGKTGEQLSVLGFGGIVAMGGTQREANNRVAEAIDRGVNYFDVAPSYGQGEAEEKLGPALEPYRDCVFLACKTGKRDKAGAEEELERSLRRMRTDHFDLYQMHSLTDVEGDVQKALGPGGAMETFLKAREKGQVRFLGFSAHSVEAALAAMESGLFDTILYPVNFVCHFQSDFETKPLREAERRGMGRLALKSMARTKWPEGSAKETRPYRKCWYEPLSDPAEAALALRWTLGQGVTAAIPPGDEGLYRVALNVATVDRPLEDKELKAAEKLAAGLEPIFPQAQKKKKKQGN